VREGNGGREGAGGSSCFIAAVVVAHGARTYRRGTTLGLLAPRVRKTSGNRSGLYRNRSGSHPKPCLKFLNLNEPPGLPVVFLTVGTGDPTVLGTLLAPWAAALGFLPPCLATAGMGPHRVVQPTVGATSDAVPHGVVYGARYIFLKIFGSTVYFSKFKEK
jgi:hypothetical protein